MPGEQELNSATNLVTTVAWTAGAVVAAYLLGLVLTWVLSRIGRLSAVLDDVALLTRMPVRATLMWSTGYSAPAAPCRRSASSPPFRRPTSQPAARVMGRRSGWRRACSPVAPRPTDGRGRSTSTPTTSTTSSRRRTAAVSRRIGSRTRWVNATPRYCGASTRPPGHRANVRTAHEIGAFLVG